MKQLLAELKDNPGIILIGILLLTMIAITAISMLSGDLMEVCNFGQGCSG